MTTRSRGAHLRLHLAGLLSIACLLAHGADAAAAANEGRGKQPARPGRGGVPASRRTRKPKPDATKIGERGVLSLQRRAKPAPEADPGPATVPEAAAAASAAAGAADPGSGAAKTAARGGSRAAARPAPARTIVARVVVPKIDGVLATATSSNPGHVILVGDLSGSMVQPWTGSETTKLQEVESGLESVIDELADISKKDGVVRDKFDVSTVGYSDDARSMFRGGRETEPISALAGRSGRINVNVMGHNGTRMADGFREVRRIAGTWGRRPAAPHPVLVVHVTDGHYNSNSNPRATLEKLTEDVAASGGQLLVTNIHISEKSSKQLVFPTADEVAALGDSYAMELFENSSEIPDDLARKLRLKDPEGRRMFAYNAQPPAFLKVLRAGSSVAARP